MTAHEDFYWIKTLSQVAFSFLIMSVCMFEKALSSAPAQRRVRGAAEADLGPRWLTVTDPRLARSSDSWFDGLSRGISTEGCQSENCEDDTLICPT